MDHKKINYFRHSKKLKLVFCVSFFFILNLHAQDLTCKDFKEGTFITGYSEEQVPLYKLIRRGGSQTEKVKGIRDYKTDLYGKLEWVDDCTYRLYYDGSKMPLSKFHQFFNDNGGAVTKMVKIEGRCLYYESTLTTNEEAITITGKLCKE